MVKEFGRKQLLRSMFRFFRNELSLVNKCVAGYQNDPKSRYYHDFNAAFTEVVACFRGIFDFLFFAEGIGLLSFQRKIFLREYFDSLFEGSLKRLLFF